MEEFQVLIIEDDKDTAVFFKTVLTLVGFECEISLTAKEALARLAAAAPDMILLDLRLGLEIGGEDILYQIRSNPRFDKTRVIIITAYPRMAEPITNLADLILLKPVDVEQLQNLTKRLSTFEFKQKRLSFRDPVTELFNQDFFLTRLDHAFERSRRRADFFYAAAVFLLQPQAPQEIQSNPDILLSLLREVAERFRNNLRPTDTVARISGWKFAAVIEDLIRPEDTQIVLDRLKEKLMEPYEINGVSYSMVVSYGSAFHTKAFKAPEDIMEVAERTLLESITP